MKRLHTSVLPKSTHQIAWILINTKSSSFWGPRRGHSDTLCTSAAIMLTYGDPKNYALLIVVTFTFVWHFEKLHSCPPSKLFYLILGQNRIKLPIHPVKFFLFSSLLDALYKWRAVILGTHCKTVFRKKRRRKKKAI